MNIIAYQVGGELYVWRFDDARIADALRSVAKQAADKRLSLTWMDAAIIGKRMRAAVQRREER